MYDDSKSCVRVIQAHINWFSVTTGVRQVEILSPLFFMILLDFIMIKVGLFDSGISLPGGRRIRDLDYADDICLLASDIEEFHMMVDTVVI